MSKGPFHIDRTPGAIKGVNLGLETLWCDDCDHHQVDPDKLDSGEFFTMAGCIWEGPTGPYGNIKRTLGDHVQIVWAICSGCLKGYDNDK